MSAEAYNTTKMDDGFLTVEHITDLVRAFQKSEGLTVDGKFGPATRSALDLPVSTEPSNFGIFVLTVAQELIGRGETAGNNRGEFIDTVFGQKNATGPWCAAFISHCMRTAEKNFAVSCSAKTSVGAKRLFRRVLAVGTKVKVPQPGDLVCWHRGKPGAATGHIGICEDYDPSTGEFVTIEGNKGPYPARVKRWKHDITEPSLLGFARFPDV